MSSVFFDSVLDASAVSVVSENHNVGSINWVAGLSDPGEMLGCGRYQQLRRHNGESDADYAARLTVELQTIPASDREKIETAMKSAALRRASLDCSTGRVAVMSAGQLPWHGLGVVVNQATSSGDAIRLASLNWPVQKIALRYDWAGGTIESKEAFAIVRGDTGKQLGTVGTKYQPIQNADGFAFLDGVLEQYGARYETAGALYGGKRVWMLAHLPEQTFSVGGDEVDPYVLFSNPHDGSGAAWCFPTAVRVLCANTHRTAGHGKAKGISIRHTGSVKAKVEAAQSALGLAVRSFEDFKDKAETLLAKPCEIKNYANDVLDAVLDVTAAEAVAGFDPLGAILKQSEAEQELARKSFDRKVARRGEILDDILARYESERCQPRGTAWGAFNAVTEHADHSKLGRQVGSLDDRQSRRFESIISGDRDELKQVAFQKALAL